VQLQTDKLEFALRKVAAEHSDKPMYFVFPVRRSSSKAPMDSSRGVSLIVKLGYRFKGILDVLTGFYIRTGVDSVEVVEIGSESEPVNRPLDVILDVLRRVGYFELGSEDVKSTLGGYCVAKRGEPMVPIREIKMSLCSPKTLSRILYFFMKSPSSFSFSPFL